LAVDPSPFAVWYLKYFHRSGYNAQVSTNNNNPETDVITDHRRQWRQCRYVYPVISRRAKGLSIGVNLNPDKGCTFGCLYCQIDRTTHRGLNDVHLAILHDELHLAIEEASTGRLWTEPRFARTPEHLRRINDIAFSGDGEPTCMKEFDQAVQTAANARRHCRCDDVKLVVITNSTRLASPQFKRALPILDQNNGEIWAKLDAGTEEYFQRVNRPVGEITLDKIVSDITDVARNRPVVIQTLLFGIDRVEPSPAEIEAYIQRLRGILDAGVNLSVVQLHTVALKPSESSVSEIANDRLDELTDTIRKGLPSLTVETFYGRP
jgi:wyosine [tRNA(Phe)-imidazoG37] synthetase (radical SAM superfamily)